MIVFHGDRDGTVHPENADYVLGEVARLGNGQPKPQPSVTQGQVPGGRAYTRTVYYDGQAQVAGEHWLVHGADHAWSGGNAAGSFTDPLGPNATTEMLRFFRQHPRLTALADGGQQLPSVAG